MKVLYFGAGANRDPRMIAAILGKPASKLKGRSAVLQDYELAVQSLDQIPETVRKRLKKSWNKDFKSYVIMPSAAGQVQGTIWELTPEERDRIRHWELVEFGWYEDCKGKAVTQDGQEVSVISERLGSGQSIAYKVNGLDYETWLNDPDKFEMVAQKNREDYNKISKTEIRLHIKKFV